jgi:hypothetical protein
MRTADLVAARRIRVYGRGGAVRAGGTQISVVAVVVSGSARIFQRRPLRVPVAPRYRAGNVYDRWKET